MEQVNSHGFIQRGRHIYQGVRVGFVGDAGPGSECIAAFLDMVV